MLLQLSAIGCIMLLLYGCVSTSACDQRCKELNYSSGWCLRSGSGSMEQGGTCEISGGVAINNRDKPITGCNFEAIGAWDECCCFR